MEATKLHGSTKIAEVIYHSEKVKGSIFTAKSLVTGKDFTFKVRKSTHNDKTYTHLYVEQGYLQFVYLGFYWEGKIYKKGGIEVKTPAAVSFAWIFRMVEINKLQKLEENVEFYHTGKCCKCGKTLTDALSIQLGLGPQCRNQ